MTTRGNTRSEKAADKRTRERKTRTVADIGSIDAHLLIRVADSICREGGALRIGLSRDGGAFSFGIYGDGEPYTEYVPGTEDVNAYLIELGEFFDSK